MRIKTHQLHNAKTNNNKHLPGHLWEILQNPVNSESKGKKSNIDLAKLSWKTKCSNPVLICGFAFCHFGYMKSTSA